jgi:undecaprenyl-diphosphatase
VVDPLIGLAVSFVAAALAVRWLVTYLQRHSLAIFGWYRLALAAVVGTLVFTGAI